MRLQLEDIPVPLGTCSKFMKKWDENLLNDDDDSEDNPDNNQRFELEIKYPPLDYDGEIYWSEFSFHRYVETSLTWHYDIYSCEN
jgi:hypothetical protein